MTAPLPHGLPPKCEYAWNAISRAWDRFSGDDPEQWSERRKRFANGLKQQLAVDGQGEEFFQAAMKAIEMLESS